MATIEILKREMADLCNVEIARHFEKFFKTQDGGYGAGDRFLGIRAPPLRKLAKAYRDLHLEETIDLLRSPFHEERMTALFILIDRFKTSPGDLRRQIYEIYLSHTDFINNWDLVDVSAEHVVGGYLWEKDRKPIADLSRSTALWERRIAIVSTFYFIRRNDFVDTLKVSENLLDDRHDLIHKAVGWMLREVGKRDIHVEEAFLGRHYRVMPRTMLRYAIEKFPENRRKAYLKGDL
jgi:3-methyladenine DNA glycosylase AlkD